MKFLSHLPRFSTIARILLVIAASTLLLHGSDDPVSKTTKNPDPDKCLKCTFEWLINQPGDSPSDPGDPPEDPKPGTPSSEYRFNKDGSVDIEVQLIINCTQIPVWRIVASPLNGVGPKLNPVVNGTKATFTITKEQAAACKNWVLELFCGDEESDGSGQDATSLNATNLSKRQYINLDSSGCSACDSGICEGDSEQGCFNLTIPTNKSNGGMSDGNLYFFTPDMSFPGRAGLSTVMPSDFTITRDSGGLITQIDTGAGVIDIADGPTTDSITIQHKDPSGAVFRDTVVSLVIDGGEPALRMDTTFDGDTTRHQQKEPTPGTTILEKGRVNGTDFDVLWSETLVKDTSTPGVEVKLMTTKERASISSNLQTTRDIEETWEKQIFGWVKTQEVLFDPQGTNLTSTWTYYQPGETTGPGASTEGLSRLKSYTHYDGSQTLHAYALNYESVTTPYADNAAGEMTTMTHDPGTNTTTVVTTVGGQVTSKSVTAKVANANEHIETRDIYTSAGQKLTTVTHYKIQGNDFIHKPIKVIHPDGTLTTYSYTRETGGGYTTVMENGATTDNTTVSQGTRTTTTNNSRGTTIFRKTEAIGYGTGSAAYELMAVTSVDNLGRSLDTAYFPESASVTGEVATALNPAWTTSTIYNCCGISQQTDKFGITTRYAYDSLKRQIKTNRLGVTIETVRNGLITETHRYPETVGGTLSSTFAGTSATLVAKSVRNLSGTLSESWTHDPTSTTAGALVKSSSTAITFQPTSGLSMRSVTASVDSFTQTTDSFLDGRTAASYGDLSPDMQYAYSVNATGETTTQSYVDGTTLRETTSSQSDWAGRALSTTYMDSAVASVEYNALGQMVKSTDPDGVTNLMAYNAEGDRVITALDLNANDQIDYGTDQVSFSDTDPALDGSDPVMITTSKVWQPGDTSPTGGTIVSTSQRSPDGLSSSSQQLGVANPSTSLTTLLGGGDWTTSSTSPDGTYTVATYIDGLMDISENFDSNDNLIASSSMRDASNTAGSGYDSLNRPVAQRDSRTGATTTEYLSDTSDIVTKVTDPGNRITTFTYDTRGRRAAVDAPNTGGFDNITYTSYYPTGQVKATWGDQTYPRYHLYDEQNRLVALHTYNTAPAGEPTGSGSSITTWVYNPQRGWLDRKEYNDGKGTDYTYTDAGRLDSRSWSRPNTSNLKLKTSYAYTAGRLTSVSYNDSVTPSVAYTYDSLGRVLNADNTFSENTYTYNASDLTLTSELVTVAGVSSPVARTLTRHYDTLLRPAGMELKDGTTVDNAVSYGYDTAGRLQSLAPSYPFPTTPDFNYRYVANSYGLIDTVTGPAHTVTNTWETTRNVLDTKTNADLASTPVVQSGYDYAVNNIGQRESLSTSGDAFNIDFRTLDWDYDVLGQVVAEDDSGATPDDRAFEFDAIGNRKKSADSLTLPTSDNYVTNALNQYTTVELASSQLAPSYDDDGNLTDDAGVNNRSSFAARTYIWDAENRLIEVKEGTTTIAEYAYDYLGRRVRKTVTDGTNDEDTVFLYDGWNVIAEYDVASTPALGTTYTWGMDLSGSMQGAGGVGGLLAVNDGTATYYPTYDGNGNVSEYLNASGADVAHNEYDAFGNLVKATGSKAGDFRYRFSTKPLDEEIGWYYYGYRYYDPFTGRWPSRDPIQERGGYNLYGFVDNNCLNEIDYLGLDLLEIENLGVRKVKTIDSHGYGVTDSRIEAEFTCSCPKEDEWVLRINLSGAVEGLVATHGVFADVSDLTTPIMIPYVEDFIEDTVAHEEIHIQETVKTYNYIKSSLTLWDNEKFDSKKYCCLMAKGLRSGVEYKWNAMREREALHSGPHWAGYEKPPVEIAIGKKVPDNLRFFGGWQNGVGVQHYRIFSVEGCDEFEFNFPLDK